MPKLDEDEAMGRGSVLLNAYNNQAGAKAYDLKASATAVNEENVDGSQIASGQDETNQSDDYRNMP